MDQKKEKSKPVLKTVYNILFFGLLIFFIFSTDAKSWVLRQMVSIGLFKPDIQKEGIKSEGTNVAFSFQDEKGNIISSNDLKGKVVFINFWATWCPPCRAEMPSLNEMYNKLKDDDRYVFLFVNEDEDPAKATAYLQKNNFSMPVITRAGQIPPQVFSGTLPTTVVLNKDGRIVMKKEGLANYNKDDFLKQLEDLL